MPIIRTDLDFKNHFDNFNEFIPVVKNDKTHLTWNIREEFEDLDLEYFYYDSKKNTLIIYGNSIYLPDSKHRHKGIFLAYQKDKNNDIFDNEMILDIRNDSFEDEKNFFVTESDKLLRINRTRVLYLSNDIKAKLVRDIIENSDLKGRVEDTLRYAKENKLLTFAALYDSLFGVACCGAYKKLEITNENYDEYKNWLIKFYNELLKTRPEFNFNNYEERKEFKDINMIAEELSWFAYSLMSKLLKDDSHWKRTLYNKMNYMLQVKNRRMDFWSKAHSIWHGQILLYDIDHDKHDIIITKKINNSNATKKNIQDIVALKLFS